MQWCRISPNSVDLSNTMEMRQICKKLKNSKAPGDDRIHNTLIKRLPSQGFLYLTIIINACLTLSYFPAAWKHANIIPIKKPGKPSNAASSYRPISLLSSMSKILERVIHRRLQNHLNEHIIPTFQHGFSPGRSTTTQLINVTNQIKQGFQQRLSLSTGMILIDIEKAFDRVWHEALIFKLNKIRTPQYITKIVTSFLADRSFVVTINGSLSHPIQIKYGVPQGAVLSPLLYNVYTHE